MSEVLKLDIVGVMNQIYLAFKPTEIHGEALKFVLASDYDALAAQRDVLVERQDALIGGYESAKAFAEEYLTQRDEGLAREAELREELRQMTVARDRWQFDYKNEQDTTGRLIDRCDHLAKQLAEAEKLLNRCLPKLISGVHRTEIEDFLGIPDCTDGEKP